MLLSCCIFLNAVLLTRRNVLLWQARRYHPDLMPKGSLILKGFTVILRYLLCIYRKAASDTFPDASPDELQAAAEAFKRIVTAYQVSNRNCTSVVLRWYYRLSFWNSKPLVFPLVNRYCVTAGAAEHTTSCPRPRLLFNRKRGGGGVCWRSHRRYNVAF
jgi:hypothetical protein